MINPIEELRKLAEAATPGPWRAGSVETDCVFGDVGNPSLMAPFNGRNVARMNKHFAGFEHDAALIAAARNALPLLLDLVELDDRVARMLGKVCSSSDVADDLLEERDTKRAALAKMLEGEGG